MSRTVALVHCPLSLSAGLGSGASSGGGGIANPLSHQLIDHYAVEVGEREQKKRYALNVNIHTKVIELKYEHHPEPENYMPVKGALIETDVVGLTSYSDDKILELAQQLILNHGEYHIICNNCKRWATEMFNTTCNVEGRLGALIGKAFGDILRALGT